MAKRLTVKEYGALAGGDIHLHFVEELIAVRQSVRSLVVVTAGQLELMVNMLIAWKCPKHGREMAEWNYASRLMLLNELGFFRDDLYELLKQFNQLRNKGAHHAVFKVKKSGLSKFPLQKWIPDHNVNGEQLFKVCNALQATVWNHEPLKFAEQLAPSFYKLLDPKYKKGK